MSRIHHVPHFLRKQHEDPSKPSTDKNGAPVQRVSSHSSLPGLPVDPALQITIPGQGSRLRQGPPSPSQGMQSSSSRSRTKPISIGLIPPMPPLSTSPTQSTHSSSPTKSRNAPELHRGQLHVDPRSTKANSASIRSRDFADEDRSQYTYKGGGSGSGHGGYMGSSPEDGSGHRYDGATSPRSMSPGGRSGSPMSRHSAYPAEDASASAKRRHTPLARHGSPSDSSDTNGDESRTHDEERRRRTKSDRNKISPLAKRLGEEPPYMLQNQSRQPNTNEQYPGVVLGAFAGDFGGPGFGFGENSVGMDGMDDFLDFAQPRQDGRHDSASGPAPAPNIAPWLADDKAASASRSSSTERSGTESLADFARPGMSSQYPSNSSLPRIKRSGTDQNFKEGEPSASSSRSGSHPEIFPVPTPEQHSANTSLHEPSTRHGSTDSVQTLSGYQQSSLSKRAQPPSSGGVYGGAGVARGSMAGSRLRMGSTVSNISSGSNDSTKRKGLFGVFKRKPTGIMLNPVEFGAADGSQRGSTSSRGSAPSLNSLQHKRSQPEFSPISPMTVRPQQVPYFAEDMQSPTEERTEMDFHLDMNLDDMEGIVDPTLANAPPQVPPTQSSMPSSQPSTYFSSLGLQGAPSDSFATTVSRDGSSGGSGGSASERGSGSAGVPHGRQVVGEAERQSQQFSRNPFTGSPTGSVDVRLGTPPSPQNLSPKGVHPHMSMHNQPRRPSQLRNVKIGSFDSEMSSDNPDSALQPLGPAWAAAGPTSQTVFYDPFGGTAGRSRTADGMSPGTSTSGPASSAPPQGSERNLTSTDGKAPAIAAVEAAWAAPESWGVEAEDEDEEEEEENDDEEGTASSADEDIGESATAQPTPDSEDEARDIVKVDTSRKPPPFGHASANRASGQSSRAKSRAGSARPGTANKVDKGRPGTSGSMHVSNNAPHWVRIYRADGTYAVMAFPLLTTTADIINILSGANDAPLGKKVTTSMKLYVRERGQDRMLSPAEKPLVIQDLRLRQAGYTDAEKIEDLGKADLAVLCKFIFQTPVLPVMDPDEENQYDSFEFIDIGGRDLQTIPIFLHLHAHNIIILNISRNPMTDIPLDFIQACTALKELRMTNNALKRVPASIRASTSLSRLDFSSNRISDLESVNLHEIATLLSLKVQNNILTSIPTYFAQMNALKYLNISNNKFVTFPAVVCGMKTLVDLDVSFNNITELPSEMSNLQSLEKLAVFGNELSQFPESFSTLANLRDLDVRRNNLTDLTAVYALPNLTRLQADWNNIVTLDAQLGAKVKTFSVPHNSITRFTLAPIVGATAVTYSLTNLNLSHAKISTLADEAFSGLVNLVDLNLNFNQFTRLPATLDRLLSLEIFSCTDNMLNDIPMGFGKMQKLRVLNVHNNNLRTLPPDIWGCGSLERLNASSNLIQQLPDPPEDLVGMMGPEAAAAAARKMSIISEPGGKIVMPVPPAGVSLLRLFLADNHLNDDVFHQIAEMPNLQVLNLSFNDIYEIPSGTLANVGRLEALYLSGNKLTSLPSEDLEKLQRLTILHLNGNKLQTLPSELGAIKTLQHLDVGSNVLKYNIANWPYDWNWNWNTALRYLNLSGNKRLEIKPTSAQEMSHTPALRKELSDFTALTQLRVLGLMDVTLRISSLPDENDSKRVRTSFAEVNDMRYGISDILGANDQLSLFDMVNPNFRGRADECLFGMFGRSRPLLPCGRISKHLQETFADALIDQLDLLGPDETPVEALRRSFLLSNRNTFDYLMNEQFQRKRSGPDSATGDNMFKNWNPGPTSPLRSGSSAAVIYLKGKTLYVGNVGANLVIISRKGEAEILTKMHDPTEREETARIRRAEAWVSPKGLINEDKELDVSRAFGYWHQNPAVNASPDVRVRHLLESDEFLIIGNRELWNCCSYQTAVDIARTERDDPMMAAQKLRDFAISYGADGSVMVMVINISDLFFARNHRNRALTSAGGGPGGVADAEGDQVGARRNLRRRYEEVGDRTLNRLQQEIEPPQGQIAIVFTDIVNSTHLWDTNPGMPTSIKIHHNLFRRQLRLDGGYEVKTEGDSFMVSFQNVLSALLWCFNCQILLLQQEWPRELLDAADGNVVLDSEGNIVQRGLRVRMGVHWGAPQCERDPITRRMDYYGPMVNRAARINASADGGQLMASQDVIGEITAIREYLDSLDEEGLSDLPPEMNREVQELRRIGLEVKDMGERKLKGLEVPEKLHLLYPKLLAGRFEIAPNINANVEVRPASPIRTRDPNAIDVAQVRQMVGICLRLEALTSPAVSGMISPSPSLRTLQPMSSPRISGPDSPNPNVEASGAGRQQVMKRNTPPMFLGPTVRDDMTDEELSMILESLATRMENSLSTLFLKQLAGFSSVLAALEDATKIDKKLLVHAMSLMSGMMKDAEV